jgi:hypothetical protein
MDFPKEFFASIFISLILYQPTKSYLPKKLPFCLPILPLFALIYGLILYHQFNNESMNELRQWKI